MHASKSALLVSKEKDCSSTPLYSMSHPLRTFQWTWTFIRSMSRQNSSTPFHKSNYWLLGLGLDNWKVFGVREQSQDVG